MERKLDDVVQALQFGKGLGRKCSLLIGAGCSVSAGIPSAGGFVQLIEKEFRDSYQLADPKTYPRCMAQLPPGVQRDLIAREVDAAKINWGHVAIAQLMTAGYVDRVLTTNFDPLVVRACAFSGIHPAVYDFAASQLLKPAQVPEVAVFHLHGQRTGFVLMNTEEECAAHAQRLGPLFQDAGRGRTWIVVGYSGANDPVFKVLSQVPEFEYGLYWIGYKDNDPAEHVREDLLLANKSAYFVRGYDADSFFVQLAQKLDCFPPDLVRRPFTFLRDYLSLVTDYTLPLTDLQDDMLGRAKEFIRSAIIQYENQPQPGAAEQNFETMDFLIQSMLMAGQYEDIQRLAEDLPGWTLDRLRYTIALACIAQGLELTRQAKRKGAATADCLFRQAGEKYASALAINPNLHEALKNWGDTLVEQARTKGGAEADRLLAEADEKYRAAAAL